MNGRLGSGNNAPTIIDTCFLFRWANWPVCACTLKDDKEGSYFRR